MWHFIIFTLKNDKYTKEEKLVGYRLNSCYFKEMNSLTLPLYLCTSALSEFFFFTKCVQLFDLEENENIFSFEYLIVSYIYMSLIYMCVYIHNTYTHILCEMSVYNISFY